VLDNEFGRENRGEETFEKFVRGYGLNRDPQRSPIQWDSSETDGFTTSEPWLPMGHDINSSNVPWVKADPKSLLWLRLRSGESALRIGDYRPRRSRNNVLVFERHYRLLFALNTGNRPGDANGPERDSLADNGSRPYQVILEGPFLLRVNEGTIKLNE
jgi:alpha-glucosidase